MHISCQRGGVAWQWISPEGATPIAEKLCAMHDWDPPKNVKNVRSFLVLANYYQQYVPRYAGIASPLTPSTKKNIEWHWALFQRNASLKVKFALCNAPLLIFPNPHLPYTVVTNALADAARGGLKQDQGDGLHPAAFMSQALKPTN